MITSLGWVFIPLSFISFFFPVEYCVYLTLISSVFQASSAFSIVNSTVNPFLYCSAILVGRVVFYIVSEKMEIYRCPWFKYIILLAIYIMIIAVIAPIVFGDVLVLTSQYHRVYSPLRLVAKGHPYTNYISLAIYFIDLVLLYEIRTKISKRKLLICCKICFLIVLTTGLIYMGARRLDMGVAFLDDFLYSDTFSRRTNSIEALNALSPVRFYGPYKEGSYCGGFLASFFCALLFIENRTMKENLLLIFCGVSIILNASSTGLVTALIGIALYFIMNKKIKKKISVIIISFLSILLGLAMGYGEVVDRLIFKKLQSSSGIQRKLMNQSCIDVFVKSKGLGVGLGNVRASSFAINMLGQLGIIGSLFLVLILYSIMKGEDGHFDQFPREKARRFCLVFMEISLIAQIMSEPDIFLPTFWYALYCVVLVSPIGRTCETKRIRIVFGSRVKNRMG